MDNQIKNFTSVVSTLIALQVLTLLLVVGGGAYALRDLRQQVATVASRSGRPNVPERVDDWEKLAREHNAKQGAANAKIVMIEFSDFQCPFCKQFTDGTRRELSARYGDRVRMVFKHLPLDHIHPQAMSAAIAAQCAAREGKFWEAHDRFFAQPDALTVEQLIGAGESLGLGNGYVDCVKNGETRQEVEQDIEDAAGIGIQGTPTFVVNGKVLVGALSAAAFSAAFKEAGLAAD